METKRIILLAVGLCFHKNLTRHICSSAPTSTQRHVVHRPTHTTPSPPPFPAPPFLFNESCRNVVCVHTHTRCVPSPAGRHACQHDRRWHHSPGRGGAETKVASTALCHADQECLGRSAAPGGGDGEREDGPQPLTVDTPSPVLAHGDGPTKVKMQRRYALTEMMGLFAMSFAYGLIFQSLVMLVIPAEVQRLTHRKQSVWMSLIMAGGALSHLGTPIVGAWSDRLHKRVSFLVYGALTCILGTMLFLMVLASNSMLLLFIAHVTTMVGLSVVYSMICALLNDCILPEQIGQGSGTLAILGTLGSGCGYALFAASIPLEYTYGGYVLACVACLGISVLYIPNNLDAMLKQAAEKVKENRERELIRMEQERQDRGEPDDADVDMLLPPSPAERRHTASATTLLLDAITMPSPTKYPDFTLACLSRMLFNAGLAAQVYMMYYFRDIQKLKAPTQMVSLIAVSTLVGCIVAALPAGIISDKVGKKPVIYTGVCICTVSVIAFFVMWSQTCSWCSEWCAHGFVWLHFFSVIEYIIFLCGDISKAIRDSNCNIHHSSTVLETSRTFPLTTPSALQLYLVTTPRWTRPSCKPPGPRPCWDSLLTQPRTWGYLP